MSESVEQAAPQEVAIVSADVGQVWRDEDGLLWIIVALDAEWIYVRRSGWPNSQTLQTHPAWLLKWTHISL